MANLETTDLMAIGKHCHKKDCRQIDFLPFNCQRCRRDFCLNHRSPAQHSCQGSETNDSKIPQCPLCGKFIEKGLFGEDDNSQVERHILSGCTERILTKRKKNRCNFGKCRTASLIPFHCSDCYSYFCVRHRHPLDHHCMRSTHQVLVPAR